MPCTTPSHPALSHRLLIHAHHNLQHLVPLYSPDILQDMIASSIAIAQATEKDQCLVCETDVARDIVYLAGLVMRGVDKKDSEKEVMQVVMGERGEDEADEKVKEEKRKRKLAVVGELRKLWDMYRDQRGGKTESTEGDGQKNEEEKP